MKVESKYEFLYEIVKGERDCETKMQLCVYCGQDASVLDYVPPLSKVDEYRSLGLTREIFIKVPICNLCKPHLKDVFQDSFKERYDYLKSKLLKNYNIAISKTNWDDEEIEELGPNLRSHVLKDENKHFKAISRYEYDNGFLQVQSKLDEGNL